MTIQLKRITTCILAATMFFSLICAASPKAWAAEKPYMDGGGTYEKIGNYYIWVKSANSNTEALVCAASKNGSQKVLKKIKSGTYSIDSNIVTDGNTIYYGVCNWNTGAYTIYKTDIKGKKHQKIRTVKYGAGGHLGGYYNGKLYFGINRSAGDMSISPKALFSYDIPKKQEKQIEETLYVQSSYGPYMVCYYESDVRAGLYNAKTKKLQKLPALKNSESAVVYKKNIYYSLYDWDKEVTTIKKCDLSGKNVKTIGKLNSISVILGKKAAYYTMGDISDMDDPKKIKKLPYK